MLPDVRLDNAYRNDVDGCVARFQDEGKERYGSSKTSASFGDCANIRKRL